MLCKDFNPAQKKCLSQGGDWGQAIMGGTGDQAISGIYEGHAVFRALEDAKVAGRKIASALGVTPSTYSKWRSGRVRIPGSRLVLLTLILADRIAELEATLETMPRRKDPRFLAHLRTLRRGLDYQEAHNRQLSPDDVRDGSRLFRKWWLDCSTGRIGGATNEPAGGLSL